MIQLLPKLSVVNIQLTDQLPGSTLTCDGQTMKQANRDQVVMNRNDPLMFEIVHKSLQRERKRE